ncbi:MAG: YciK family oxidoreductase [Gammaproteobacteria bacterium]|nr:YciK family oxidoreductase [Gammaproteobacteria bacterium]
MFDYRPPADLLAGRAILVTGAGSGIGRACVLSLLAHGANVVMLSRSRRKLESLYDEAEQSWPGRCFIQPVDFSRAGPEDFGAIAASLEKQFPALDGLVHNAAVLGPRSPIEFYPEQQWQEVMQVNVNAAFLLTRTLLPLLAKSTDARVLFTASAVGREGRAWWGAYGVSKFAVEGLMQTLAAEVGTTTSIRVNSLNPGGTRTAMRAAAYPGENPDTLPTPESLMPVYLYLLGPDGRDLHGQTLDARDFNPAGN